MKTHLLMVITMLAIISVKAQINPFLLEGEKPPLVEIQKAIEYNLDYIKIEGAVYYRIYAYKENNFKKYFYYYFTERARERMVELFEGKWTEEEVESRANASIKSTLDTLNPRNGYYQQAKKISKRDSLAVQKVWDSMLIARKNKYKESIRENRYVDYRVISIAGFLKDPRFLSYLMKMGAGDYVTDEVELALARYGIEPYHSRAVKKYAHGDYQNRLTRDLEYICSRDAIKTIYNYIMTEDKEDCLSSGECIGYWAESGAMALETLFGNKDYSNEIESLRNSYRTKHIKPDKAYLKKMRTITERYYQLFKNQTPDCENVPVNAW